MGRSTRHPLTSRVARTRDARTRIPPGIWIFLGRLASTQWGSSEGEATGRAVVSLCGNWSGTRLCMSAPNNTPYPFAISPFFSPISCLLLCSVRGLFSSAFLGWTV